MAIRDSITRSRRQIYIVISTLFILGFFIGLYFSKFVPENKEELNQRGFRILRQIVENVKDKNKEYKKRLNKNINSAYTQYHGNRDSIVNVISKGITANNFVYKGGSGEIKAVSPDDTARTTEALIKDDNWQLQYATVLGQDKESYLFETDFTHFLSEILSYRKDVFDSYVIIKKDTSDPKNKGSLKDTVIFQSEGLGLGNVASYDSLFNSRLPITSLAISEYEIAGTPFKLFLQPFELQNQPLLLVGLLKKSIYNKLYLAVPPSFLYTVSLVLMLFVLSFPFLKIAFVSSTEKLSVADVIKAGLSLVTGTAIIVIMISGWYLFQKAEDKTNHELSWLADSIEDDFLNQIKAAYGQIKEYDSIVSAGNSTLDGLKITGDKLFIHPHSDKIFDQVFWLDSLGMQRGKWEMNKNSGPYIDVHDRNYFTKIVENEGYELPYQKTTAVLYIEPAFSNISGEFKVNVATRSNVNNRKRGTGDRAVVVGLTSRSYNETAPILPREYSFCITDATGKVLIHSDVKRSLKENFLEETNQDISIQEALKKRDERIIDNVEYYGRKYRVHVEALPNLPLFLIVLHNQDRLGNANTRVFAFSLTVSVLILLFLALNHKLYLEVKRSFSKLLFHPNRFRWLKPQPNAALLLPFYHFILRYFFFVLLLILLDYIINLAHFQLLFYLAILSPFYAYWGAVFIQKAPVISRRKKTFIIFCSSFIFLNAILSYFITSGEGGKEHSSDNLFGISDTCLIYIFIFQALSLGFIFLYNYFSRKVVYKKQNGNIVRNYAAIATLIVIVAAVVPPIALVFYGYNEEKTSSEKLDQLHLAEELQIRNLKIEKRYVKDQVYKQTVYKNIYDTALLTQLKFNTNVFTKNTVLSIPDTFNSSRDLLSSMDKSFFYEKMLSFLQKSDYASDSVYQIENYSGDSTYYWGVDKNDGNINLIYTGIGAVKAPVRIISQPRLHAHVGLNFPLLILFLLLVASALYAVYRLIKYTTNRVFLIGYSNAFSYCEVKEDFLENFADHIIVEKLVVLDENDDFLNKIKAFSATYEVVSVAENVEDLIDKIHSTPKRIVILSKQAEETLLKAPSINDDVNYFSRLSKINTETNDNCDSPAWNIILLVKPKKLSATSKINEALIATRDVALWSKNIISNLTTYFSLYQKNRYIKAFHRRLVNKENRQKLSESFEKKNFRREDLVINMQHEFENSYQLLWQGCTEQEKYVLYDFARDGIGNYKNESVINNLIRKGIFIYRSDQLRFFNVSFRNFLLSKTGTEEIVELDKQMTTPGKFNILRIIVFIVIIVLALFVVLTQEEAFKKITAILGSLVAVVPMLMKLFEGNKGSVKISK